MELSIVPPEDAPNYESAIRSCIQNCICYHIKKLNWFQIFVSELCEDNLLVFGQLSFNSKSNYIDCVKIDDIQINDISSGTLKL
jgi:hypothetical protein